VVGKRSGKIFGRVDIGLLGYTLSALGNRTINYTKTSYAAWITVNRDGMSGTGRRWALAGPMPSAIHTRCVLQAAKILIRRALKVFRYIELAQDDGRI